MMVCLLKDVPAGFVSETVLVTFTYQMGQFGAAKVQCHKRNRHNDIVPPYQSRFTQREYIEVTLWCHVLPSYHTGVFFGFDEIQSRPELAAPLRYTAQRVILDLVQTIINGAERAGDDSLDDFPAEPTTTAEAIAAHTEPASE